MEADLVLDASTDNGTPADIDSCRHFSKRPQGGMVCVQVKVGQVKRVFSEPLPFYKQFSNVQTVFVSFDCPLDEDRTPAYTSGQQTLGRVQTCQLKTGGICNCL